MSDSLGFLTVGVFKYLVSARPKGVRLGYMGHLTLISEDVISTLEHLPPDLRLLIAQHAPQPEWDEYVTGRYKETKKKDTILLGGGKPVVQQSMRNGASQWKVDEADTGTAATAPTSQESGGDQEMNGDFRRTMREASADFGAAAPMDDDDDDDDYHSGAPHVGRALFVIEFRLLTCHQPSSLGTWRKRCNRTLSISRQTRRRTTTKRTEDGWRSPRSTCVLRRSLLGQQMETGDH